jgi:hypothetical protein
VNPWDLLHSAAQDTGTTLRLCLLFAVAGVTVIAAAVTVAALWLPYIRVA